MFYTKSELAKIRGKRFAECLVGALSFSIVLILIFLMGISDDLCKSICSDVIAFGLPVLAARVWCSFAINHFAKKKHHNKQSTATVRYQYQTVTQPVPAPAPVDKPMFFDFEAHE